MADFGLLAENMVPAPAAAATPRAIFTTEDGIMLAYGSAVPDDGTGSTGYAPGCLFIHTDGTANSRLLINDGSAASADFDVITAS
jgi:hypothetical protein